MPHRLEDVANSRRDNHSANNAQGLCDWHACKGQLPEGEPFTLNVGGDGHRLFCCHWCLTQHRQLTSERPATRLCPSPSASPRPAKTAKLTQPVIITTPPGPPPNRGSARSSGSTSSFSAEANRARPAPKRCPKPHTRLTTRGAVAVSNATSVGSTNDWMRDYGYQQALEACQKHNLQMPKYIIDGGHAKRARAATSTRGSASSSQQPSPQAKITIKPKAAAPKAQGYHSAQGRA